MKLLVSDKGVNPVQESTKTSEPRFRWIVAISASLLLAVAMGTLVNGMSAFLVPLEDEFGWQRAETAAINSFGLIGIAIGGVIMGILADKLATRIVCLVGAVAMCLALLLSAHAEALWQFYTLFFIAGALGGGAFFAPVIALVGGWFRTGAGLAIGVVSAGQATGQGLVPYGSGYLIELVGWQDALTYLGIICAVTLIPLSFVMIEPPKNDETAATQSDNTSILPPKIVLPALSVAVMGCCAGMAVPLIHLVPLIQLVCGVGAEAGGPLLLMLVTAIAGRIFFGRMADTIGPLRAWMVATVWQTVLMLGFMLLGSIQAFWLFVVLYGFGYGGVMTGVLVSVRSLTPESRRASATGIVLAFAWLGHAAGGWQGGLTFDISGAYFWAFANATIFGLINLAIVGTIYVLLDRRLAISR